MGLRLGRQPFSGCGEMFFLPCREAFPTMYSMGKRLDQIRFGSQKLTFLSFSAHVCENE
jgi:hypothetical protein